MAALTTLNITEKNANNSLSVTVKVNVTKEGSKKEKLLSKNEIKVFPQNMIRNIIAEPAELKTVRSILKPDIAFTVIRITGFQKMTNS